MRPVYATRLTVMVDEQSEGMPGLQHSHLATVIHNWFVYVGDKFGTAVPLELDNTTDSDFPLIDRHFCRFDNPERHCFGEITSLEAGNEEGWFGQITHPFTPLFPQGRDLQLRAEVQLYTDSYESTVTIRLLIGSEVDVLSPVQYNIARPKLVKDIIESFTVFCGNIEVRPGPWRVDAERMKVLVADINRHDRTAPIVVISRTPDNATLFNPTLIADMLGGLAQVAVLEDFDTAYLLTNALTKEFSTYNGAVRIYWPEFSISDSPYKHTLFTPEKLNQHNTGYHLPRILFDEIAAEATLRIGSDRRVLDLERRFDRATQEEREREMADLLAHIQEMQRARQDGDEQSIDELYQLETKLREQAAENKRIDDTYNQLYREVDNEYKANLASKNDEIRGLKKLVNQLDEKLKALRLMGNQSGPSRRDRLRRLARAVGPLSLDDILTLVEEIADPEAVVILPAAHESAKSWEYTGKRQPVVGMLAAVCLVAEQYHAGALDGNTNFVEIFREEGEPSYSLSSEATLKKYRHKYERVYSDGDNSQTILLNPHVGFGSGTGQTSVKVYWHVDTKNKRFLIGQVGEHLPIVSHRS